MAHPLSRRLPVLLAASAAATVLVAAPASATDPTAPAAGPTLPSGVAPVTFAPVPSTTTPVVRRAARVIRRARLVPRRVGRGRRALLRVALTTPSRLRIVISRRAGGRRVTVSKVSVPVRGRTVARRLPRRSHGRLLPAGRYRVRVVAVDAQGARSLPVRLALVVRRAARR